MNLMHLDLAKLEMTRRVNEAHQRNQTRQATRRRRPRMRTRRP
jgi:hypothetical protein